MDKKLKIIIGLIVINLLLVLIPFDQLSFEPTITGKTVTKVRISGYEKNIDCNFNLSQGWNLFSLPCNVVNNSISNSLSTISSDIISVHYYDNREILDKWKTYNPTLPNYVVQDLTTISNSNGYWINLLNNSNLETNGTLMQPFEIQLEKGWNLIGYPADNIKLVDNGLISINGYYVELIRYNSTDDSLYYYNGSHGNITNMLPYYGYWINMTGNKALFVT